VTATAAACAVALAFITLTAVTIAWLEHDSATCRVCAGRRAAEAAARHPTRRAPVRCLACPDRPVVFDWVEHSRLWHGARTPGPDDDPDFLDGLR